VASITELISRWSIQVLLTRRAGSDQKVEICLASGWYGSRLWLAAGIRRDWRVAADLGKSEDTDIDSGSEDAGDGRPRGVGPALGD